MESEYGYIATGLLLLHLDSSQIQSTDDPKLNKPRETISPSAANRHRMIDFKPRRLPNARNRIQAIS